jgi:ribonuclease D
MFIETQEALAKFASRAARQPVLALDTEFVWTRTFYPRLGIVQLGWSKEEAGLIDIPAIEDLSALASLVTDGGVVKILHDALQDLQIIYLKTGALPKNIFDTRLASGFCGLTSTLGLNALLTELLDIELDKSVTRTDWLQRPLTEKQETYALEDVRYLNQVRELLLQRVEAAGNTAFLEEDLLRFDNPVMYRERDPYEQYTRLKGTGAMAAEQLSAVRELAAWRELTAREKNLPRGFIVDDKLLVEVAKRLPRSERQLKDLETEHQKGIRRYGARFVEIVVQALDDPYFTHLEKKGRMSPEARKRLDGKAKRLVTRLTETCSERQIDPALVGNRNELRELLVKRESGRAEESPLMREGWRKGILEAVL